MTTGGDDLDRLNALREAGALTQAEFDAQKAALPSGSDSDSHQTQAIGTGSASAPATPLSGGSALDASWQSWMAIPACVGAALVALIIALVVLPVGPDVGETAMEASVLPEIQRDAPPSQSIGARSFGCTHGALSTSKWTCKLRQDVSLLPDVTVAYKITVGDDRCWTGTSDGGSNPSGALLPATIHACVGRAAPKLRPGLLIYKSYDECMRDAKDADYCAE
jgi:hypothetical protein